MAYYYTCGSVFGLYMYTVSMYVGVELRFWTSCACVSMCVCVRVCMHVCTCVYSLCV